MRFNTLLLEINDAHWQREENLRYQKLTRIFQKFGLHTSNYEKVSSAWLLFYANLLKYKLLNIHI